MLILTKPKRSIAILTLFTGVSLIGCSSTPEPNAALDAARADFYATQGDPQVIQKAPVELQQAQKALTEAERLHLDNASRKEVEHHAYLAKQRTAIARETVALEQAEEVVENAEVARTKTLLSAKEQEIEKLKEELHARETERGLMLTLGDVLFDTGSAALKPGAIIQMNKLAAYLQEQPERSVLVEGFTDSVGSESFNMQLSQARAESVRMALISAGLNPARIQALGYGESYPIASNANAAGRQQNRRVEIIVSDAGEMVSPLAALDRYPHTLSHPY